MKRFLPLIMLAACACSSTALSQSKPIFADNFDTSGALSSAWTVATWVNGHPFGCTFSPLDVAVTGGLLNLSFSGNSGKCAEVRIEKRFQYGKFQTRMKPSPVPGTISSFFMYDGVAGTASHYEIDIEFIGGTSKLHTNYWVGGVQNPVDIDLAAFGIDPYAGLRTYGFEWRANNIVWFTVSDTGVVTELRRVPVKLSAPMRLTMNAWYGDNTGWALYFPGYYAGEAGVAVYDRVQVFR